MERCNISRLLWTAKKNLSTFHALAADEKDNLKMTITRGEFKTRIQYDALKPIPWA